jgi:putative hemolysin
MMTVLLAAGAVVLLSGLFSMVEAAFLSLPLVRARALAKLGGPASRAVLRIREKIHSVVSVLVILDTVVDLGGSALVATLALEASLEAAHAGNLVQISVPMVTAGLTLGVIVFGEVLPKTIGERFHVGICLAAAFPVLVLVTLFHPVVWAMERLVEAVLPKRRRNVTTVAEISELTEQARSEGAIGSREAEVIQRVFRLGDITAEDIMTPRIRCRMLPADAALDSVRKELGAIAFSRIPVYAGTRDHVTGILRRSEALYALVDGGGARRLEEVAAKPKFVPATMAVQRVLLEFQKERVQLAIVVGEYGEVLGLITLEDIFEELVGEILDEKDLDERSIKRVSREEILVHGQTEIARINHFFNTELPEDRPTIAGLLLERLGRLPRTGEHVLTDGVDVVVDEVTERAIVRVRILKGTPPREAAPPGRS